MMPLETGDRMISLDPGIRMLGIAEFNYIRSQNLWSLTRAALIRNPVRKGHDLEAAYGISKAAVEWVGLGVFVRRVVCEVPQIYRAEHKKGDENISVVPLAMVSAMFAARCGVSHVDLIQYYPRDWKGQTDPDLCCRNVEKELSRAGELARVEECPESYRHNVLDAIGIGLKYAGRFEPFRVYPE